MRRIVAGLAVVVGITLIVFTFAEHLFSRSSDAQTIATHYRPLMSSRGLADLSHGFDAVKAAGGHLGSTHALRPAGGALPTTTGSVPSAWALAIVAAAKRAATTSRCARCRRS